MAKSPGPVNSHGGAGRRHVVMDLRMEGTLNVNHRPGKVDPGAALAHILDGKAMGCQPACCRVDILGCRSESRTEFLRSEPVVVVGGSVVLLPGDHLEADRAGIAARRHAGDQVACRGPKTGMGKPVPIQWGRGPVYVCRCRREWGLRCRVPGKPIYVSGANQHRPISRFFCPEVRHERQ